MVRQLLHLFYFEDSISSVVRYRFKLSGLSHSSPIGQWERSDSEVEPGLGLGSFTPQPCLPLNCQGQRLERSGRRVSFWFLLRVMFCGSNPHRLQEPEIKTVFR